MSKDIDIDNIFSDKIENEIKSEIKKKRKKSNLRLIVTTIICTLVIIIVGNMALSFASDKYIEYAFSQDLDKKISEYMISNPNEYIGKETYRETGYFHYESTYEISKRIGGRVLHANSINDLGGLNKNKKQGLSNLISESIPTLDNDIEKRKSSAYGVRNLEFLYPYVNYENTINDFHYLDKIDDEKTVEMSLSFDKEYTYDEINNAINSDLITFYWIDDNNKENREYYKESKYNPSGDRVIGIKSNNYDGEMIYNVNERIANFKKAVDHLKKVRESGIVGDINFDNIKISGIVVVGTSKELKELKDNSMIKHAVIGSVVDKY